MVLVIWVSVGGESRSEDGEGFGSCWGAWS